MEHPGNFQGMGNNETSASRKKGIYRITIIGSIVNLLLLVFKFIAGFVGHSSAMIADAVHSLSDFVTDIIVLAFVKVSARPEDEGHDYGHGKYETLATVIIGAVLLVVGFDIMKNGISAIIRVYRGEILPAPGILALVAALLSIAAKEILYQYTVRKGKSLNSQAVIANAWHHRSDALSSIGTAIGIGGAILLGERWRILDPIAAVAVSVFIIRVAWRLTKSGIDELLEISLPAETESRIRETILSFPEVSSPHHLRTRRIGNNFAIDVHVRMNGNISLHEAHETATKIERKLREEFGSGTYVSIHMEPEKQTSDK